MKRDMTRQRIVYYRGDCLPGSVSVWLDRLEILPAEEWQTLFHRGKRENCYHAELGGPPGTDLFYKSFETTSFRKRLLSKCTSPAWHAFKVAHVLQDKGIPTPAPVCYVLFREGLHQGKELLCTHWINNAQPLGSFTDAYFFQKRDTDWVKKKRGLVRKLAEFVAAIHRASVYHGDFNINNILVCDREDTRFYLIDTGDIRSVNGISRRRVLKNLDEVNRFFLDRRFVTHTDRLRFLHYYLENTGERVGDFKKMWRQVQRRTLKRLDIHGKQFVS